MCCVSWHSILRIVMHLLLFAMFVYLFGYPSTVRYLNRKTHFLHERTDSSGFKAPSLTFCAQNMNSVKGWKNEKENLENRCKRHEDNLKHCIDSGSFNRSEILKKAYKGYLSKESLQHESIWKEDFENSYNARCHTFRYEAMLTKDDRIDQIMFFLDNRYNYRIMIHDERYFWMSLNPLGLPSVMISITKSFREDHYYRIICTDITELNVPQDPCEEDPHYNFQVRRN
jgi:hypothetical protein